MKIKNLNLLQQIKNNPHKLGHFLGYKDLTELHSNWIKKMFCNYRYTLLAHRNSYKTSCIVVGAIWYLLFNPNETILIIRKDFDNSAAILDEISRHYKSDRLFTLFNVLLDHNIELSVDNRDKLMLNLKTAISKEKNLEGIGIGGSVTGRHYDRIICDDIVTIRDRISKAEREKTILFYGELQNILKKNGKLTVSGTVWHKNDLFSLIEKKDIYTAHQTNILSSAKLEELRKSMTSSLFACNYLLTHIQDNGEFSNPKYEAMQIANIIGVVDPAYSGKNTTAFCLINTKTYQCKIWAWRKHISDLEDQIISIANNYYCGSIWIETNADKGLFLNQFQKKYQSAIGYNENQNKHNKITTYIKKYWERLTFDIDIGQANEEAYSQIVDYEEGKEPDDAPDVLASALRIIESNYQNTNMTKKDVYQEIRDIFSDF